MKVLEINHASFIMMMFRFVLEIFIPLLSFFLIWSFCILNLLEKFPIFSFKNVLIFIFY